MNITQLKDTISEFVFRNAEEFYGGISYNKKSIMKKIQYFTDERLIRQLKNTMVENMDFEAFFQKYTPKENLSEIFIQRIIKQQTENNCMSENLTKNIL